MIFVVSEWYYDSWVILRAFRDARKAKIYAEDRECTYQSKTKVVGVFLI